MYAPHSRVIVQALGRVAEINTQERSCKLCPEDQYGRVPAMLQSVRNSGGNNDAYIAIVGVTLIAGRCASCHSPN